MANYKEIQGFPIQNLSSDPVPYAQELINNPYAGVWSSGGNMNTTRFGFASGTGTQTAGMISAGEPNPVTAVEQYNGTSWTEVSEMNTSRDRTAGSGTQSATLIVSGRLDVPDADSALVESWNGSAWTEVGDVNTARYALAASVGGTYTSTIIFGGAPGSKTNTESWNGSAWTEVNDLPTGKYALGGAGTLTAALSIGGVTTTNVNTVESWDGTNWTSSTAKNTTTGYPGSFGSQTAALATGGWPDGSTELTNTESWDGSAWTEVNDMATARAVHASSGYGSSSTGLVMGGYNSNSGRTTTEEWTFSGLPPSTPAAGYSDAIIGQMYYNSTTGQFKAIKDGGAPIGTWSSGGNMNNGRAQLGSAALAPLSTGFGFGGFDAGAPATRAYAESYDGTSWTEGPDMPSTARLAGSYGVSTSALSAGGSTSPSGAPLNPGAFEWDGTSWSGGGTMNNIRRTSTGSGSSVSAGRIFGGGDNPGPAQAFNESYDGTSFTEEADLNTARIGGVGVGTLTAALNIGGPVTNVEEWNGSSWTEIADINSVRLGSGGRAGTVNDALSFSSSPSGGAPMFTEFWNGTSWTEVAELTVARYNMSGGGPSSTNALAFGGYGPPAPITTATEEWTAGDFDITTLTTS